MVIHGLVSGTDVVSCGCGSGPVINHALFLELCAETLSPLKFFDRMEFDPVRMNFGFTGKAIVERRTQFVLRDAIRLL
jgi:hypothetical protein